VDAGGNLMAVERIDGTFAAGANVAIGKARTAVLFKKPTRFFEDVINKGRTAMTTLADFTPLQGGVPIVVDSQIVGAVGVSGANSAAQDDTVATVASLALQQTGPGRHASATDRDGVTFFDHRQVAAAFAKGAVLLDGTGRNYMVHASRREEAGQAEVHALDTDVIYVLGGGATFVTGGKVVGGKESEPGEVRGAAIEGGDVRRLAKGDVITVPSGTPHWFREISGPLTYYVVKVR
jgi:glc operon protein GlcG